MDLLCIGKSGKIRGMKKKIRVGIDFDGVIAYNPFRVARAPISWIKKKILGVKKLTFFVPKNGFEKWMWTVVHESSILPAIGISLLKKMSKDSNFEFFLITARYGFLKSNLMWWLEKQGIKEIFKEIHVNDNSEQPHIYKLEKIKELDLDYFIEDNLDIVMHANNKTRTKVLWIFNLLDKDKNYEPKFPYLEKALRYILEKTT